MKNPMCCGAEAKWVDNGPNLQYYFCAECKNEVNTLSGATQKSFEESLIDDFTRRYDDAMTAISHIMVALGESKIKLQYSEEELHIQKMEDYANEIEQDEYDDCDYCDLDDCYCSGCEG